jgi:hypothetical protein
LVIIDNARDKVENDRNRIDKTESERNSMHHSTKYKKEIWDPSFSDHSVSLRIVLNKCITGIDFCQKKREYMYVLEKAGYLHRLGR